MREYPARAEKHASPAGMSVGSSGGNCRLKRRNRLWQSALQGSPLAPHPAKWSRGARHRRRCGPPVADPDAGVTRRRKVRVPFHAHREREARYPLLSGCGRSSAAGMERGFASCALQPPRIRECSSSASRRRIEAVTDRTIEPTNWAFVKRRDPHSALILALRRAAGVS